MYAIEWAEVMNANRVGLRVMGAPFVRFEEATGDAGGLRVLSAVAGRSTKFNRPERSSGRRNVAADSRFVGSFPVAAQR